MYTIKQIAEVCGGDLIGTYNASVDQFLIDSRQLLHAEGTIFFALTSNRNDGHSFIPSLVQKGVRAFVVSNPSVITQDVINAGATFIVVNNTLEALQKFASVHRSKFTIPVIAITGSNGKTMVKEWLYQLLRIDHNICRSPKSYNSQIGVPLSVLNLNTKHTIALFEAGISLPGEMKHLEEIIRPTIGILTSFGEAHDSGFASKSEKLNEKLELFKGCNTSICNIYENEALFMTSDKRRITIGRTETCDFILSYVVNDTQCTLKLRSKQEEFTFEIPFIDKASVLNAATCIVTLLHLGKSKEQISERLMLLQPIALRLEVKNATGNSILINDFYNSDIDSIRIAFSFLNQQHRKQRKVLFISDIDQSGRTEEELYKELAKLVKQNGFDSMVGIGACISNYKHLFDLPAKYFPDVTAFLKGYALSAHEYSNASILLKAANRFSFDKISRAMQQKSHDTKLEIDLNKLTHNVNYYRSLLTKDTRLMCMVKAMGYGAGGSEIATTLKHIGVQYLAVAYADEGVELRTSNIDLPIMVMSPEYESLDDIVNFNLEPEIYSLRILEQFIEVLDRLGIQNDYPVHIKIDTGMKRLGFEAQEIDDLIKQLRKFPQVKVKSVFSHLVASDNAALDPFTHQQIHSFESACEKLQVALGYKFIRHICNTGGISRFKQAHYDMVRLGIGMYGFGINTLETSKLENVSALRTRISQIKHVAKNETVGYNRRGVAERDLVIATIPIGYADGFHRSLGNGKAGVYINGSYCKTIGNICMDMCMVDVTDIKCSEGDEVCVFESADQIAALAEAMGTIPYEVLTGISGRVKRVYIQE